MTALHDGRTITTSQGKWELLPGTSLLVRVLHDWRSAGECSLALKAVILSTPTNPVSWLIGR